MDAIPEGEGCSFNTIAIGLIVLLLIILFMPGFSWMVKIGLGAAVSFILIAVIANQLWNNP